MRSEANAQGMRSIPLEDLQRAIIAIKEQDDELVAEVEGSLFGKEIREAPLSKGFKLLNIKVYNGKNDPSSRSF